MTVLPRAETVFRWATDRCAPNHIPDAPARAFRAADGAVRLIAAHHLNRAMTGPSLDRVRVDCTIIHRGAGNDDPLARDDRVWLAAFHTKDGLTISALAHAEYHGHLRTARCPGGSYTACWRNAVVGLISLDAGRSFTRPPGTGSAVAVLPYGFDAAAGRPIGYFSPSNILSLGSYEYAFVFAEAYRDQRRGACLLRTRSPSAPASWRAWNGSGFATAVGSSPGQVCAPVPGLGSTITSVVRHAGSGVVIALFAGTRRNALTGSDATGVWYVTSTDLLRWSAPRLLFEAPIMFAFRCGAAAVYAYPSLMDGRSPSRNFDVVSGAAHLYLTRFNMQGCKLPMNRDLVRLPVRITAGSGG